MEAVPTIVHATHHKAGSQWIRRILQELEPERTVRRGEEIEKGARPGTVYPACYLTREELEGLDLPPGTRRFVVIRDLRDTIVSLYWSLKVSHAPTEATDRLRDELQRLSLHEGMLRVIGSATRQAEIQRSWARSGEQLIRYEDLLERDTEILVPLLADELGLGPADRVEKAVAVNRFDALTGGRQAGAEDVSAHERKGVAGDWRNYIVGGVREAFKEVHGELLVETGYERDLDW